jgi:hypothetical protein
VSNETFGDILGHGREGEIRKLAGDMSGLVRFCPLSGDWVIWEGGEVSHGGHREHRGGERWVYGWIMGILGKKARFQGTNASRKPSSSNDKPMITGDFPLIFT